LGAGKRQSRWRQRVAGLLALTSIRKHWAVRDGWMWQRAGKAGWAGKKGGRGEGQDDEDEQARRKMSNNPGRWVTVGQVPVGRAKAGGGEPEHGRLGPLGSKGRHDITATHADGCTWT